MFGFTHVKVVLLCARKVADKGGGTFQVLQQNRGNQFHILVMLALSLFNISVS